MRHILMSIRPEWVEKILNYDKTSEIRRTCPKEECIVEIYCTKGKTLYKAVEFNEYFECCSFEHWNDDDIKLNGKVVAVWHLKNKNKFDIKGLEWYNMKDLILEKSCLTEKQLKDYVQDKIAYSLHIDELQIYDKPIELSEFGIKKAPQSWCYLEDIEEVGEEV